LHVAVLVFVPGCAIAAWWQIMRAADGNQLSYLYSVMWPAFGLLGLAFWWILIHTDYETVGLKGMRRQQAERTRADTASPTAAVVPTSPAAGPVPEGNVVPTHAVPTGAVPSGAVPSDDEDPELAAYNARLAALSAEGPKTWRHRESVVVRRAQ
jgi:hypothetical protein